MLSAGGAAGPGLIGRRSREANRSKEGGGGEVYEKSFEMRQFRALARPEEPQRGPCRSTELAREGQDESRMKTRMKRTASRLDNVWYNVLGRIWYSPPILLRSYK